MHPKLGSLRFFHQQNPMLNSYMLSVNAIPTIGSNVTNIQLPRKGTIRKITSAFHWTTQPPALANVQTQLSTRAAGQFNANVSQPSGILVHQAWEFLFATAVAVSQFVANMESGLAVPVNVNDVIYLHTAGTVGGGGFYAYNALIWVEE